MPCFDLRTATSSKQEALEKKMPAVLCVLIKALGDDRVVELIDWPAAGVTKAEFREWWETHQLRDAKRKVAEISSVAVIEIDTRIMRSVVLHPKNESVFNGFKYSDEVLMDSVSIFNSQLNVSEGLGELNISNRLGGLVGEGAKFEYNIVKKQYAAIKVTNVYYNPKLGIVGDVELLDNYNGNRLKQIIDNKDKYIFRMRANIELDLKSLNHQKVKKCRIISFDVVSPPPEALEVIF